MIDTLNLFLFSLGVEVVGYILLDYLLDHQLSAVYYYFFNLTSLLSFYSLFEIICYPRQLTHNELYVFVPICVFVTNLIMWTYLQWRRSLYYDQIDSDIRHVECYTAPEGYICKGFIPQEVYHQ